MKLSSKLVAAAAAALFAQAAGAAATVAQPSVIIYGGGATLPADAYVGDSWLDAVPSRRLSNTLPPPAGASVNANAASKGSLFSAYALSTADTTYKAGRVGVSYCQTGSGTGRGVITNTKNGTGICGDYASTPTGFSADTRKADFGASDAPLSQGDINAFNATTVDPLNSNGTSQNYGTLYTQPVQFPAVAGAIAIVYNNPVLGKTQLNLTRKDICQIFSGAITDWSALTHTPKQAAIPSKPIRVVYRSDSSGTTFSFSNFLSQVCPTVGVGTGTTRFYTANSFIGGTAATFAAGQFTFPAAPAAPIGASGNGGVVNAVAGQDGAIGYAEVADAVDRAKRAGGSNLKTATVAYREDFAKATGTTTANASFTCTSGQVVTADKKGKYTCAAVVYNKLDPAKNFLAKGVTAVEVNTTPDFVLPSAVDTSTGRFTPVAATGLTNTGAVPGCVLLVSPDAYAESPTAATKTAPVDYSIYPIKAVSYLLAYGTGNGAAKTPDLQTFLASPFDTTLLGKVKTIGKTTGYAPVSVKVNGAATTMSTFISGCVRQ